MSKLHELKTHPVPFSAVRNGSKPYEVRKNDRDFHVGDTLLLKEFYPDDYGFSTFRGLSGSWVLAKVTYMTQGGEWGLPPDLCVLGISVEGQG